MAKKAAKVVKKTKKEIEVIEVVNDSNMELINKYKPNKAKLYKHIMGRPTKYKASYPKEMFDFFFDHGRDRTVVDEVISFGKTAQIKKRICGIYPMFSRFAHYIGVTEDTLQNWKKVHPHFLVSYNACKTLQKEFLSQGSMNGNIVSNIGRLFLSANHGVVPITKNTDETGEKMKGKIDDIKDEIKDLSESVEDLDAGQLQDKLNSIIQIQG